MVQNNIILKRINAGAIILVFFGFVAGLRAEKITLLKPRKPLGATKVLSFPSGQCMGNLYLEPESGPGWDPKGVRLLDPWEHLRPAQGDVRVPEDRNIKLHVSLALSPRESAKLRAQNPQAYQWGADRTRKNPKGLFGLSELNPNDLFWLSVSTEMYLRTGVNPRIFDPIRRLTGLQILSLHSTGITDKGSYRRRPQTGGPTVQSTLAEDSGRKNVGPGSGRTGEAASIGAPVFLGSQGWWHTHRPTYQIH
ncbi:MAG: hypothetical protein ACYS17_04090 [Planctomycetota bacterium]